MLRVFHLFETHIPKPLVQAAETPVVAYLRLDEILVNGGEFDSQQVIKVVNDSIFGFQWVLFLS